MTLMRVVDYYAGRFKYTRHVLLTVGLGLLTLIAFFGYRWYRQGQVEKAHAQLAGAIELFERADQENSGLWQEVDQALENGYKQYANSSLAPFFLAFQAEVALRLGNTEKARELEAKALHDLSKKSPFYMPYAITQARMNIDSGQPDLVNQGTQALQKLAEDAALH